MALKTPHTETAESRFMQGFTLALILSGEGKRSEAIPMFERLADEARNSGIDSRYETSCYEEISKCYLADENYSMAVDFMESCKVNAERHNQLHMFAECLKTLSSLYDRLGQTDRSLQLKARYLEIKDSIFNVREFDNVKNQQFVYEMNKVSDTIEGLNREMERRNEVIGWQRTVIIIVVIALAAILVCLFLVYLQKRRLRQSYTSLYRLNKEAAAEQERIGEINRRMRREIKDQSAIIDTLNNRLATLDETPSPAAEKYSTSNLNQERRDSLADAIAEVMENSEDFCARDFSLDTLAEKVGSNAKYVSQVINEVYGKNFNSYINHYRIRLACERLADSRRYGHLTIKAIGDSVGYKSPTSFINAFRKINGMTPSIYQKMAREDRGDGD